MEKSLDEVKPIIPVTEFSKLVVGSLVYGAIWIPVVYTATQAKGDIGGALGRNITQVESPLEGLANEQVQEDSESNDYNYTLNGTTLKRDEKITITTNRDKAEDRVQAQSYVSKTSSRGIDMIKRFEGFSAERYNDAAGYPTIGYGHLLRNGEEYKVIKESEAIEILRNDLARAESAVNKYVNVKLNRDQYDAAVSFVYNIGDGAFSRSTFLKKLNNGNYHGAADEMLKWNKAGGKVVKGLNERRKKERALFLDKN